MNAIVKQPPWQDPQALAYTMIVPTVYGQMLVNRHDINQTNALVKAGCSGDHHEILLLAQIMNLIAADRKVFVDVGANFGAYTLGMARHLGPGGLVYAFEAQRLIFQLLCGTMALNSVTNAHCLHMAIGAEVGKIPMPQFDYFKPMNFGSVEFGGEQVERLHQERRRDEATAELVPLTTLDALDLPDVHMLKIDAEGMDIDVLRGARATVRRGQPVLYVEHLKVDQAELLGEMKALDYTVYAIQQNFLGVPRSRAEVIKFEGLTPL